MNSISVCIPNFNRTTLLFEALQVPLEDERVSEIVIVDDCSDYTLYSEVMAFCYSQPKIKLFRNEVNQDCFKNKRIAVSKATNEYVVLLDSDNSISKEYIDAIFETQWMSTKILQPTFAKPHFDFRKFGTGTVTKANVKDYLYDSSFTTALNAMNYFVNRDEYLRVWDGSVDPVTSDSIWQNYCWLNAGNSIYFVPGMHYKHRVDDHKNEAKSHYSENNKRTPKNFHMDVIKKLKQLR